MPAFQEKCIQTALVPVGNSMKNITLTSSTVPPPLKIAWFIWGLGALLYLMGFFQRVAPAMITTELMRDFQINASALGNLSAFYFYSYAAMQIPTGTAAVRADTGRTVP
jgi:hypothetical protein